VVACRSVEKICWARRLPPPLLKRLYQADARGFRDLELCEEVGSYLYVRCETFARVACGEVECPLCGTVFAVAREGRSHCPGEGCRWETTQAAYRQSIRNHYAATGRARAAYETFHRSWPTAKSYSDKILLIDQLIQSFHVDEKTGRPVKSVASKLLEGNKKEVVRFLDELSALDPAGKEEWRRTMATTIDARELRRLR
jgi:uncharacterized Zn finger protein (UPF0148 family)